MLDFLHVLHDTWNNLPLCGGRERVPTLSEDLDELLCKITACQAKESVMQSVTFVDGHCVGHTVRVRLNVRRAQEQDRLDRHGHGEHVERRRSHHGGRGRLPKHSKRSTSDMMTIL